MMSDLHIKPNIELERQKNIIDRMVRSLNKLISNEETVLALFCGDIIDNGEKTAFENAKVLLDYLMSKFEQINPNILYRFVPGNHDLCEKSLDEFERFTNNYTGDRSFSFSDADVITEQIKDINFIYTNTFRSKDYNVMDINWNAIKKSISDDINNVIVAHKGFVTEGSESENSSGKKIESTVPGNAMFFKKSFCPNKICYYLHGDTHIYHRIEQLNRPVFGVGPLFSTWIDVNSQFILFDVKRGKIEQACKFFYMRDHDEFFEFLWNIQDSMINYNYLNSADDYPRNIQTNPYKYDFPLSNKGKIDEWDEINRFIYEGEINTIDESICNHAKHNSDNEVKIEAIYRIHGIKYILEIADSSEDDKVHSAAFRRLFPKRSRGME